MFQFLHTILDIYMEGKMSQTLCIGYSSVYEKLFETSDIMSDVSKLCAGHFQVVPDISFSNSYILKWLWGQPNPGISLIINRHATHPWEKNLNRILSFFRAFS